MLLIFEHADYFLEYFAEIYEKVTRENAGTKYLKSRMWYDGISHSR